MPDCQCCSTAKTFDAAVARRDLKRYRRRGPDASTRQLLSAVQSRPLPPAPTLLDIGGGVGAIHHVLLEHHFVGAIHVDPSPAYLAAAADESARLGHTDRVAFQQADFTAAASTISPADVVTLDRVVCCDPDYGRLLGAAAARARRVLAFSYPRPRWPVRAVVALTNAGRRLFGNAFRVYIHPPAAMRDVLEHSGMKRSWSGGTWVWAVEVFERGG